MAVDAARHAPRKRQQSARAAKERRQKIILGFGLAVLALLVVWQGPKTLKALHGGGSAPVSVATTPTGTPAVAPKPADLREVNRFSAKDPFVEQVAATVSGAPQTPEAVTPPAVRTSSFVAKDPFIQQVSLLDTGPTTSTPTTPGGQGAEPAAGGKAGYIVLLASLPLSYGHTRAEGEAALARKRGVGSVKIVDSSNYATLRSGFFAVYSGPYASLGAALKALEEVRGRGYASAYTRRIAR